MPSPILRPIAMLALGALLLDGAGSPATAASTSVEALSRSARIEAYRAGRLPLPGTPELARLDRRLAERGLERGAAVFVRIFKETSELELWLGKGDDFVHFDTYPICAWDGGLGPKLYEGDRQSPEGLYTVSVGQLRWLGRWHRGFDLGFPNAYDVAQGRTGSAILIHGGCSTVGCFAMTDPVMDELFDLATAAMAAGQPRFAVHVFPFRMTASALAQRRDSPWIGFWEDLRQAYDQFEETRVPPRAGVCRGRYALGSGRPGYDGSAPVAELCPGPTLAVADRETPAALSGLWPEQGAERRRLLVERTVARMNELIAADRAGNIAALVGAPSRSSVHGPVSRKARAALARLPAAEAAGSRIRVRCNPNLASCRHWIAVRTNAAARKRKTAAEP